jgi:serine/threonine-protein kinase ATR
MNGSKYLYESLPRLLTIWMDSATIVVAIKAKHAHTVRENDERLAKFNSMSKLVQRLGDSMPTYQLLTAIPQLISRISHTHPAVKSLIDLMISRVFIIYPKHTIWHLMVVCKSTNLNRAQRASLVLTRVKVIMSLNSRPIL